MLVFLRNSFLYKLLSPIYKFIIYRRNPKYFSPITSIGLDCLISYNKYGGYCVPRNSLHRPAAQAIMRGVVWESDTIDFIINNCNSGAIVHAGTFFGDFLPALSSNCSSRIFAFEPNPENFKCAEITCKINSLTNVTLTNSALGKSSETLPMVIKAPSGLCLGGSSFISKSSSPDDPCVSLVNIVSLDEFLNDEYYISIIQLDVEGYETDVLLGALKTIKKFRPILILELLPSSEVMDIILSFGYLHVGNLYDNHIFTSSHD